jgi:hypothetical protein
MLGGAWDDVTGACICPALEFIFLCFFFAAVLPSVAAFAGATTGIAADAIAKMATIKSLMADLLMRFSRLAERPFAA